MPAAPAVASVVSEGETVSDTEPDSSGGSLVDRVKGTAKNLAGTLTGNEDLKQEGELHQAKAGAAETAADLQALAAREQEKAELIARELQIDTERRRLAAEAAAEARQQQTEIERTAAEQRIAADTKRREAAVDQQTDAQRDALDRQGRRAATERQEVEQNAAQLEAQAAEAERAATVLDATNEEL
jgi:uncharacterized protein YjbJ (UPF0337 family)